ncbi:MAG: YabP/YqfC family sporulation protein [Clostridia bacterium]|jgi:sporulation protein YabP|nr:YabP/YqfC family sporulation protein [Clostridia bacterium]MDD4275587.1 YabP/YqfC family sporulation protein [Clostridia bacterium]
MPENEKPNNIKMREHKLALINQKNLSITGLESVVSVNANMLVLKLSEEMLSVAGTELHITKLDVEQGIIEVEGIVDSIKYSTSQQKLSLLKRLFK